MSNKIDQSGNMNERKQIDKNYEMSWISDFMF